MRKPLLIALPIVAILVAGTGWWFFGHTRDPIAAAKQRMARGDMRGAALYLTQAARAQPENAEVAFLLGKADLAVNNPAAAQLEFLRARDRGWDKAAIVLPLGQAYLQQRHFTELLHDFDPDTLPASTRADVLSLRATAQMSLRDLETATATADAAEALAPHDAQVLLTVARIALLHNDLVKAGDRAEKALNADPKPDDSQRGDAKLLQAEIALRQNDPKAGLALAKSVLSANPTRLDAKLMEARALASTGQEQEARTAIEAVLHAAPRDVPANFLHAMLAIHAGDFAAADASLQQIAQVIPELPRGYYFVAVTKLGMGQVAQAADAATQFLSQKPDDINGLKLMAFIDLASRHPDRALSVLQTPALAAHPDADMLDLRGRALAMAGDLKAAKDSFAEASALQPQDVRILNRLAATELNLGDSQAGEADLKHSLELAPDQRLAGEAIVQSSLARGDIDAARKGVEALRKKQGDSETVGVLDAQVKMAALDMAGAETELRDVLNRFPDSRAATLSLVRIDGLKGDDAEADSLLEAKLRKHPSDIQLLDALLPMLFAQNQIDRAVKAAQIAHDAVPDNASVTAALAGAYLRAKQPDRAVGLLDRASADSNGGLDFLRARILAQEGKPDLAKAAFQSILDRTPGDTHARSGLAALMVEHGDFDDARDLLRDGLKQAPGSPELLGDLVGVDLRQAGRGPDGVKKALATAASLRAVPANLPAASFLAGNIYLDAGDPHAAAAAFAAAYKAQPSGPLAVKAASAYAAAGDSVQGIQLLEGFTASHKQDLVAQSVLSSLYLNAGRFDEAASRLHIVLAADPTDVAALNNLAWIAQQQGDLPAARSLATRAYFQSARPEIADTLGWILFRDGETDKALPLLKQGTASADPKTRAAAAYHYGAALAAAGKRDEARMQIESALAAKVFFHDQAEAEKLLPTLQ